jgi:autotransporter-associated beta strand protein
MALVLWTLAQSDVTISGPSGPINGTAGNDLLTVTATGVVSGLIDYSQGGVDTISLSGAANAGLDLGNAAAGSALTLNAGGTIDDTAAPGALAGVLRAPGANTLTVTLGGLVVASRPGTSGVSLTNGQALTLVNTGTIRSDPGTGGFGVDIGANLVASFTNSGVVTGDADGVMARLAATVSITNSGTVTGVGDAIDVSGGATPRVTNSGTLNGALNLSGTANAVVDNSGQINGNLNADQTNAAQVTNSGTLTGAVSAATSSNFGLTNTGTINSAAATAFNAPGSLQPVTVTSTGTLTGTAGIATGDSADVLSLRGVVTATAGLAISTGGGDDQVTFRSGLVLTGPTDGGAGNDTLTLDGSGTYGGDISAFETLVKQGQGAWTLSGTATSAATRIDAGTLVVTGNLISNVTVNAGGTLTAGNVAGAVVNSGGVDPAGAMNLTGAFTQNAGGVLRIDVTGAAAFDRVASGGAVALDGTLQVNLGGGFLVTAPVLLNDVVAGTGRAGTFAAVTGPASLLVTPIYGATDVDVQLSRNPFVGLGSTSNQRAVGAALDAAVAGASGNTADPDDISHLIARLDTLSAADLRTALDRLSPEVYNAADSMGLAALREFARPRGFSGPRDVAWLMAPEEKGPRAGSSAAWARPFGIGGDQDGSSDHVGFEFKGGGLAAGAELPFEGPVRFGVLAGASVCESRFDDDRGRAQTTQALAGLDVSIGDESGWHIGGSLAAGPAWTEARRTVHVAGVVSNHRSDTAGWAGFVQAACGRMFEVDRWTWGPVGEFVWTRVESDGFTESGPGATALVVEDRRVDSARSALGFRVSLRSESAEDLRLSSEVSLRWAHEFLDEDRDISARFSGTTAGFTVAGRRSPRDAARVGARIGAERKGLRLSLRADLDLGFEGYVAYGVGLELTLEY